MTKAGRFAQLIAVSALSLIAVATATFGQPPTSYIIDNPTPSHDFGPSFLAKIAPAAGFPGPGSGLLFPKDWLGTVMDDPRPLAQIGRRVLLGRNAPSDLDDFYAWLGVSTVTLANGQKLSVGANEVKTQWGTAVAFGCAACHSQNFFGTLVFGMGNKAPRANETFMRAKTFLENAPILLTRAGTADNAAMIRRSQAALHAVGALMPQALGLDTSIAQVALSLSHRAPDGPASFSSQYSLWPRTDVIDTLRIDSKPPDWYGVKYKDRYASDGAIAGGDLMLTVFLWNEIGRGSDLNELDAWIKANSKLMSDLNKMVRSVVPPRIGDFVATPLDVSAAQHGEILFLGQCASCHGIYEKNWAKGTQTVKVDYPKPTRAMDVGTDIARAAGVAWIAPRLNALDISQKYGIVAEATGGYVAPPLVGVWSRYPYLHNRSIPNLCELLKPEQQRVTRYYVGTTDNIATDYDAACVGYPTVNVPASWQTRDRVFDTRKQGLSNSGHNYFVDAPDKDKRDLIEYLKTL